MSTPRKLGVFLCLLGFAVVCVLALTLNSQRYFAGLGGIESKIDDKAEAAVGAMLGDDVGDLAMVDGRELSVVLPDVVPSTFDRELLTSQLNAIDGVRSVELLGQPTIAAEERPPPRPTAAPEDPQPTEVPEPEPAPEPTEAPEPEPAPEPTEAPEPEPEPEPEPTEAPEPEPTEAPEPEPTEAPAPPTLTEVVDALDLGDVVFEPGTARFTAQDTAVLDGIADQLQGLSGGPVQVQAHTDNVGDPDVNLLLSQDRAEAVVAYLIDRGVDASLLTSRGFGAQVPIADNSTEQGRAANQRVVLVVEGN